MASKTELIRNYLTLFAVTGLMLAIGYQIYLETGYKENVYDYSKATVKIVTSTNTGDIGNHSYVRDHSINASTCANDFERSNKKMLVPVKDQRPLII
ncbi:MAG: hypothetical protein Q8L51_02390, partial [Candidatus Amesbacteria bacterium]|nr:hypothetical protein [Candidatus Amesbacteria bacterium]